MKKFSFTWTVFFFAIVYSTTAMAVTATERKALIALYKSTKGDSWFDNSRWKEPPLDTDGFAMPGTECDWYGITLCTDSRVIYIELSANNLNGPIPSDIGNLANLELLALVNNNLEESIPLEIGNLTSLNYIYLQGNQLTGTIPSEIGKLISLKNLKLGQNKLTGSIPAAVGNIINLNILELQDNRLTGNIPASFRRLQYDCEVNVSNNCLADCFENASHLTLIGADSQDEACQVPLIPGDINDDEIVNIQDAILLLKISSSNADGMQINGDADLNCDNVMGLEETIYVLQSAAELRQ